MAEDDEYAPEEIEIQFQEFISFCNSRNKEDSERASSAGESRQKIGAFIDQTGINSQALSWMRSILKKKKFAQKMDIIRSIEEALPFVKAHVMGNEPDLFEGDGAVEPAENEEWLGRPTQVGDEQTEVPAEIAEEADDFEKHLAEVAPE